MPPRSSSRSTSARQAAASAQTSGAQATRPIFSPAVQPTQSVSAHRCLSVSTIVLWVVVISFCASLGLSVIALTQRVRFMRYDQLFMAQRLDVVQRQLVSVTRQLMKQSAMSSTTSSVPLAPPVSKSPSGALSRGSLSPDGTKYAGYEDAVKGKIGLSIEMVSSGTIKRIEIFSPTSESTGAGSPFESAMSVRWKDNQTIEYDVLVTKLGVQKKETRNAKIFF